MIGFIQKCLLDLVQREAGTEGVAEVRKRARVPVEQVFRISEVYADDEWQRLLDSASEYLGLTYEQVFAAFAEVFFEDALRRFPRWFALASSSKDFFENQITIHNTFASGVRDPRERQAVTDKFRIERAPGGGLVTHYRSPNKLCQAYRALGHWILRYYGDEAEFTEPRCMLRGDDECEIHIRWTQLGATRPIAPRGATP